MIDEPPGGYWTDAKIRVAVLDRDGHKCVRCGSEGPRLALHHRDYVISRRKITQSLPSELVTLCMSCHGKVHHADLVDNPFDFACRECGATRRSPCYLNLLKCKCGALMRRSIKEQRHAKRVAPIEKVTL